MIKNFALCGAPEAGKSKVQSILSEMFDIVPIDDSRGLRDAAKILYDLTEEDVTTQEGKRRLVAVGDKNIPVREILGELGRYLELNDPLHIPKMARRRADQEYPGRPVSFGSVRMKQGLVFKDEESLVIEVVRPGVEPKNQFDFYDRSLVDIVIVNSYDPEDPDGSSQRLLQEVRAKIEPFASH
jgi:hypothetical protein